MFVICENEKIVGVRDERNEDGKEEVSENEEATHGM